MDEFEPERWPAGLDAALDEARRPVALAAERKRALWSTIAKSTGDVAVAPVPRSRTGSIVAGAVILAVAASLVLWLGTRGHGAAAGQLDATARTTIALAERGIAVAEDGSALRWTVDNTEVANITQTRG